jgi:hypothetical protein
MVAVSSLSDYGHRGTLRVRRCRRGGRRAGEAGAATLRQALPDLRICAGSHPRSAALIDGSSGGQMRADHGVFWSFASLWVIASRRWWSRTVTVACLRKNSVMTLSMWRCRVSARFAAGDVVDVEALRAVGQLSEERSCLLIGGKPGGEVGRDVVLPRRMYLPPSA